MKALVHQQYGSIDGLELQELPRPEIAPDEVLVQVRATTMNADIWHVVAGKPRILRAMGAGIGAPRRAKIPGTDVAGVVASVGAQVAEFALGARVFGDVCEDFQWRHGGSFAEYVRVKAKDLAPIPEGVSFEDASTLPTSAMIALRSLRIGGLNARQNILINGAGGNVGQFAVQLAKTHGAKVTAVDCGMKLSLLQALGADHLINYEQQDILTQGGQYDLILDVASTITFRKARSILAPTGKYVLVGHDHYGALGRDWLGCLPEALGLMALSPLFKQLPPLQFTFNQRELLLTLSGLLAEGRIKPRIDNCYSLSDVSCAYARLLSGEARGHLVMTPHTADSNRGNEPS